MNAEERQRRFRQKAKASTYRAAAENYGMAVAMAEAAEAQRELESVVRPLACHEIKAP